MTMMTVIDPQLERQGRPWKGKERPMVYMINQKALRPKGMIHQVENDIVLPGSALNQIENDMIPHTDNLTEGKGGNGKILQKTSLKALRPNGMLLQVEKGIVLPGSALNPIENEMIPHKDNLTEGKGGNGKIPQKMNLKALRPEGMVPQVEKGIVLQRSALNPIENDMIPHTDNLTEGKGGSGKTPQKKNLKALRPEGMVPQVENGIVLQRSALNPIENDMVLCKDNLKEGKGGN